MPAVQGEAQPLSAVRLYVSACHQHQLAEVAALQQALHGRAQLVCDASAQDSAQAGDGLYAARQLRHRHVRDAIGTLLVWGPGTAQGPHVDFEVRTTQALRRPLLCLWLPGLGPVDAAQLPAPVQAMLQAGHAACMPWADALQQPAAVMQALRQLRVALSGG